MKKILIVDDDVVFSEFLEIFLTGRGFQVQIETDGAKAIETILQTQPSIILLDIHMPGLDGIEVTRFLVKNPLTAHIPVVIISSSYEDEYKEKALQVGAYDYIDKGCPDYLQRITEITQKVIF